MRLGRKLAKVNWYYAALSAIVMGTFCLLLFCGCAATNKAKAEKNLTEVQWLAKKVIARPPDSDMLAKSEKLRAEAAVELATSIVKDSHNDTDSD